MESYIKDSQNLIQKANNLILNNENNILYSCDFESLYTNINHDDCLNLICDFLKDKLQSNHIKIEGFYRILKLILDNNYFFFQDRFYRQRCGIAMGSKCGPSIANVFVYIYEKKWLTIYRPLFYVRFIDDIFLILNDEKLIESLKISFGSLKLNVCTDEVVNFLDLNIKRDNMTKTLYFTPYYKPTNTFSYLLTNSNHPNFIFKNIPKSLFIRLRRICSYYSDFLIYANILKKHLIDRGYDMKLIEKTFNMVSRLDRQKLIEYKEKKNLINKNLLLFRFNFDKNIKNFKEIFRESFKEIFGKDEFYKGFDYLLINKMQNNIQSLTIHDFRINFEIKNRYKRCENLKCKTCQFANFSEKICFENGLFLPICEDSDCSAENCIYILKCDLCKSFYIGQTNCFKSRFNNHLSCIKNFKPFSVTYNNPVSNHFNLRGHNYLRNLSFFIIQKDILSLENRLTTESFFINLFKKLGMEILNDFIPKIQTVYDYNPEILIRN